MSISEKQFDRIKARNNPMEILYYAVRCLRNADPKLVTSSKKDRDEMKRMADRLGELLPSEPNGDGDEE